MTDRSFHRNDWPTLGVEVELQLVDAESMALKSAVAEVLADLPAHVLPSAKNELFQS
jgi:carboxylate-amine ligase